MTSWATYGAIPATTARASFNVGNDAMSSWSVVVASTSAAFDLILLHLDVTFSGRTHVIDVGTGESGSEVVLVSNVCEDHREQIPNYWVFEVPTVPSGTRVVIRGEGEGVHSVSYVMYTASAKSPAPPASPTYQNYGITLATALKNTLLDPGGTAHTKAGWVEITPASPTNSAIDSYYIHFGRRNNSGRASGSYMVDIGIGAPGSQTVVIANVFLRSLGNPDSIYPSVIGPLPADDIANQRVWMNIQSSRTTTNLIGAAIKTFR